jgi:predicted secreted protein
LYLSNIWCVVFFEGAIALAMLMALTELVTWWVVLVLPLAVAGMVKLNDLIAGTLERHG